MASEGWIKQQFKQAIQESWAAWVGGMTPNQKEEIGVLKLLSQWSGSEDDACRYNGHAVLRWRDRGPNHSDLFGANADQFKQFCDQVGVEHKSLVAEPPTARRSVFKRRLNGKLDDYKKRTGRSIKALCEHLGWPDADYQWLRRIKSNGADHARSKGDRLRQLTRELDTTVDYLFGVSDVAELPTWDMIIELGIEEFARRQPEKSEFAEKSRVRDHLMRR